MELGVKQVLRPCHVRARQGHLSALFHGFFVYQYTSTAILQGEMGGQQSHAQAVVEFENGQVNIVNAYDVKFLDSREKFEEFSWMEGDEK